VHKDLSGIPSLSPFWNKNNQTHKTDDDVKILMDKVDQLGLDATNNNNNNNNNNNTKFI